MEETKVSAQETEEITKLQEEAELEEICAVNCMTCDIN